MGVLAPAAPRAQSVSDYRLPGATETPPANPNVQGPVDPDVPVVRGPAPRPSASAPPAPASTPPSTAPTPAPSPQASRTAAPAAPRPAPALAQPSAPGTGQPASPAPVALPPLAMPVPDPGASPAAASTPPPLIAAPAAEEPAAPATDWRSYWPFAAAALALMLAAIITLAWRRRRPQDSAPVFEAPVVRRPTAAPQPQSETPPAPQPQAPARSVQGITIELEARRMSASLMATTLSYNLRLTNHTGQPLSALAVEGDMVSAHASLAPDKQIASPAERLELRHALVSLAVGESALFSGDLRLPLAAITPIRAGDAAYFVPLARLRVEASSEIGIPLVEAQTFVIGELAERPGAPLRPFRLDLGPRNYDNVGQRAVN